MLKTRLQTIPIIQGASRKRYDHVSPENSGKSVKKKSFSDSDDAVAKEFNEFFNSIGQNNVEKIYSLANECSYDLTQSSFVPRCYLPLQQFSFRPVNRPFPSCPGPLFQNEGRCSAFDMEIIFYSHANKTHFHKKGCAPSLILKVRVFGTRKWPVVMKSKR